LEADIVIARADVQVTLRIANKTGASLVIPVFEGNEISAMWSFVEQKSGRPPKWERAYAPKTKGAADVLFPNQRVLLKPGESQMVMYRFNPSDLRLPDGKPLRCPGKVRVTVSAWLDEKWIGLPGMEFQLSSNEFDIPAPPKIWGQQPSAASKTKPRD
jgi:hypothetical protein